MAAKQLHPVASSLRSLTAYIFHLRPFGGPCIFMVRQCINLHKLLVFPVHVLILHTFGGDNPLAFAQPFGPAAVTLLACHSIYGIMWVFKDVFFPDTSWQAPMSPLGFVAIFVWPLSTYYVDMFCLVTSSATSDDPSPLCPLPYFARGDEPWVLFVGVITWSIGMFYHFGADLQKYTALNSGGPRRLITDGFFTHSRNPNYFGEVMIYSGFAILSCNYSFFLYSGLVWLIIFVPNMLAKDVSMSRYDEWENWAAMTGFFFPYLPMLLWDVLVRGLRREPSRLDHELAANKKTS